MTTILFAILAALQLGDILTTLRVLGQGGVERNPVLAPLFRRFGSPPVLIAEKVLVLGLVWIALPSMAPQLQLALLGASCALYVWIVWHNWTQIRK